MGQDSLVPRLSPPPTPGDEARDRRNVMGGLYRGGVLM